MSKQVRIVNRGSPVSGAISRGGGTAAAGLAVDRPGRRWTPRGLAHADVTAVLCADQERTRSAPRALGPGPGNCCAACPESRDRPVG